MSLKDQVVADVKQAMKDKDSKCLEALRFLHSALKNKEIDLRPQPLSEEASLAVVQKLVKQLKEAMVQYEKGGRKELAEKEAFQLKIVTKYLPQPISKEQITALVEKSILKIKAPSLKDMGLVMKDVLKETAGRADNQLVSQLVREKLQKMS